MNIYGVVTGTDNYTLNVAFPAGFNLQVGDTVTIRPQNANTGASTLNIGLGAMPLTLNGAALTTGQLEAGKDRQCTFIGSGFALDNAGSGGGASNLDGLSDVVITSPAAGDFLRNNGTNFINVPLGAAETLTALGSDWQGVGNAVRIFVTSADGADDGTVSINGGGAAGTSSRGARIIVAGNEHATIPGQASVRCGDVAGAFVGLYDNTNSLRLRADETGVKPQGTGGTGHLLFQASANGAISSRVLAPSDMPALTYAKLTRTTDQTGNTGGYAVNVIAFNSVPTNEGTLVSNSSGVVTLNKTGTYFLWANCRFASNSSDASLTAFLNGTTTRLLPSVYGPAVSASVKILSLSGIFRATSGDVVRLSGGGGSVGNFETVQDGMVLEFWLLKEG